MLSAAVRQVRGDHGNDQYPPVPARINDDLDTLLFLDTGMAGIEIALPMSTVQAAG